MTDRLSPQREAVIVARIEAATECPQAEANGRMDGQHTWSGSSFTHTQCELCRFTRPRGERAEEAAELAAELAAVRAERDEAVLLRDFTEFHLRQLRDQRGEAEVANEAWELGQITAEEALRRTDAAIQSHKTVSLEQFRAEREATS